LTTLTSLTNFYFDDQASPGTRKKETTTASLLSVDALFSLPFETQATAAPREA
jgi:hypothetical protein